MNEERVRVSIAGVVVLALFCVLFARLWYLQVAASGQYQAVAQSNRVRVIPEPALRGRILDDKGRVLVDNRLANVITVSRQLVPSQQKKVLARLGTLLGVPPSTLAKKLADPRVSPYTPVPIATDVPFDALAYVSEHNPEFPGVKAEPVAVRRYVYGSLAAHVLGYVGEINDKELAAAAASAHYQLGDEIGKSGVEQSFESVLRGKPGDQRLEIDSQGRVLGELGETKPVPGKDVRLTIDLDVQKAAEDSLLQGITAARSQQDTSYKAGYRSFPAPAGAVVVLNASDGSVVAMASYPTYDPNDFVNGIPTPLWNYINDPVQNEPLTDRAIAGQYAPGSTFKLVTATAGLDAGLISEGSTIDDKGVYHAPGDNRPFTNDNGAVYGPVSLARAVTVSSDVYFYTIGGNLWLQQKRGNPAGNAIQDTARQFGLDRLTGIDLSGEQPGRIPDAAWKKKVHAENPQAFPYGDWLPGDNILSAVGQGDVLVTPLQLARAYGAFASGGTLYTPHVVDAVVDVSGRAVRTIAPRKDGAVPEPAHSTLMSGFQGVVNDPQGTAYGAFADFPRGQISVAGKTGTAQVQGKASTSVFVGITPLPPQPGQAQYVAASFVEQGGYGASISAPIVRRIMQQLYGLPLTPIAAAGPSRGN